MKIVYGSLTLATDDLATGLISGSLALNGQQVNDEVHLLRAAAAVFFARGNRSATVSFFASVSHATQHVSERQLLTHFWDLPTQDVLRFWCGPDGDQEIVSFPGAVIDGANCGPVQGITGAFRYAFRVTAPITEDPPPALVEPTTDMIKRSTTAIPSLADHVDVVFAIPFASVPIVVANVQRPAGGDAIWAVIRAGSVTVNGFTADLSGAAPDGTYSLAWIACA
jgi:hypothetical protein